MGIPGTDRAASGLGATDRDHVRTASTARVVVVPVRRWTETSHRTTWRWRTIEMFRRKEKKEEKEKEKWNLKGEETRWNDQSEINRKSKRKSHTIEKEHKRKIDRRRVNIFSSSRNPKNRETNERRFKKKKVKIKKKKRKRKIKFVSCSGRQCPKLKS